jgi:hypothetical protein
MSFIFIILHRFRKPVALVPLKISKDLSTPEIFKKELVKVGGVYGLLTVKIGLN